jgi:hypothetical protein
MRSIARRIPGPTGRVRRTRRIVDEIGVALRFATATVTKATRTSTAEGDDTAASRAVTGGPGRPRRHDTVLTDSGRERPIRSRVGRAVDAHRPCQR